MKNKTKNLWTELINSKEVILILTFIWIALFEQVSVLILTSGVLISIGVVLFTDHFLLDRNYGASYSIGLGTLVKYFSRLFYEIIVSGFQALPVVFSGKMTVHILTVETKLKSEFLINLLTSGLTLTPGTLTVSKHENELKVLTFNPPAEGEDLRKVIPTTLENILKKYEEDKNGERIDDK